ncbi:MAG: hypothetical protein V3U80_08340 [Flavobacteriaceae bacterium]
MKTIKLAVVLLITAFMFNACTEEEIQENTYVNGQIAFNQAAHTKLQIVSYVKDAYMEEYGDDNDIVQNLEQEEEKLMVFKIRIDNTGRIIGPIGPIGPIDPIPVPVPCDVLPDFNVLNEFDGLDRFGVLNKIDEIAIGLNCEPSKDLSSLGIVIKGFQEVDSYIYTLDGELVGAVVDHTEDVFGQPLLKYGTNGYSGNVIVTNEVIMEGGLVVNITYPAFID